MKMQIHLFNELIKKQQARQIKNAAENECV